LHGPPAIKGIEACRKIMKDTPQVGVFDTSFYSDMEEKNYIYALPYEYYEKYQLRKYGFHGTSHRYVSSRAAEMLGRPIEELKIIVCHLGNGSSITAVKNGHAIDTSMGFTPQDGLPMGTRSGALDPTVITYLMKNEGLSPDEMDNVMNKKSGLLGVSGVSSDCREVMIAEKDGNKRAALALELLVNSIKKIVGSYIAEMNGIDALAFTAGIGENDSTIRERVCSDMSYLGIEIDTEVNTNAKRGTKVDISKADSRAKVLVIPTDEEYMIALDTQNIVTK
jgi:acetate kinase